MKLLTKEHFKLSPVCTSVLLSVCALMHHVCVLQALSLRALRLLRRTIEIENENADVCALEWTDWVEWERVRLMYCLLPLAC